MAQEPEKQKLANKNLRNLLFILIALAGLAYGLASL